MLCSRSAPVSASPTPRSTLLSSPGTGKTRIAAELIAAALPSLRAAGQVAVFLAPSVSLVRQVGGARALPDRV